MKKIAVTADGTVVVKGRLAQFMASLQKESDRGVVIVTAVIIEELLQTILKECLPEEPETKKLLARSFQNLDSRARACFCLGFISRRELTVINEIRDLRNEFAHQFMDNSFDGTLAPFEKRIAAVSTKWAPAALNPNGLPVREMFNELALGIIWTLWDREDELIREGIVLEARED